MALAEVVTLYDTNCRDIPEMLRGTADAIEIEQGEGIETECMLGIQMTADGGMQIYGWGNADNMKAIALLQLAVQSLSLQSLGWD